MRYAYLTYLILKRSNECERKGKADGRKRKADGRKESLKLVATKPAGRRTADL